MVADCVYLLPPSNDFRKLIRYKEIHNNVVVIAHQAPMVDSDACAGDVSTDGGEEGGEILLTMEYILLQDTTVYNVEQKRFLDLVTPRSSRHAD